ncbi:MAG: hypothetical protein AAF688_05130, partial [Bacteroidota bacterium]
MLNTQYLICQEVEFLNQIISPYSKNNPIPKDTLFLNDKYTDLAKYFKVDNINSETLRDWWGGLFDENKPPIELFLKHFTIDNIRRELNNNSSYENIEQTGFK